MKQAHRYVSEFESLSQLYCHFTDLYEVDIFDKKELKEFTEFAEYVGDYFKTDEEKQGELEL